MLNQKEKDILIQIARKNLESFFQKKKVSYGEGFSKNLQEHKGAFVTLRKFNRLRGCMGNIISDIPLYQNVGYLVLEAAFSDPRFPPLKKAELPKTKIEISVLSRPQKVESWQEIKLGKHGVIVRQEEKSGVFLPQVAIETNWNLETFLSVLCQEKAGLPSDAWQDKKTDIYIFETEVFAEK